MAGFAYQRRPGWQPSSIVSPEDPVQGQPQPWDAPEPVQQQADVADVADERPWRVAPMPTTPQVDTTPVQLPGPPPVGPAAPPPPQVAPPGPPQPGQQEQTYRSMLDAGPRKSVLGRIAAGAIGAAAGYSNAAGRARQINLDPQKMRDMVNRNPNGGGPYDAALARQKALTEEEQAQTARETAWQQQQAQQAHLRTQNEAALMHGRAAEQQAATSEGWRKSQADQAAQNEKDKQERDTKLRAANMQKITVEEAQAHGIPVSPEEAAQGYVTVHRALWTRVATQDAKVPPPEKVMNHDAWVQQQVRSKPGSPEYMEAQRALKIYQDAELAKQRPSTTAGDKELTRKAKAYVGGLENQYNGDWEKIKAAINADKMIGNDMRSEANAYALKMGGRPKANKGSAKDQLMGYFGGSGGGRGGNGSATAPPPVKTDPLGVR